MTTHQSRPEGDGGDPAQASSKGENSATPALDPAAEEKLATITATASVELWAADEVRKLLEPGEMPQQMLMCAGSLKSIAETGSLAESLRSMLKDNTVLVATDRRIAWVSPEYSESGSGSVPLSEVRELDVPRVFMFGRGQVTLILEDGRQVPLSIAKKRKSEAEAFAGTVAKAIAEHGRER